MRLLSLGAFIFTISLSVPLQAAQMSSSGYVLHDSGTTSGSNASSSGSFKLQGTLQSEEGQTGQGTLWALRGGAWQVPKAAVFYGDLNGDGVVDAADRAFLTCIKGMPAFCAYSQITGNGKLSASAASPCPLRGTLRMESATSNHRQEGEENHGTFNRRVEKGSCRD